MDATGIRQEYCDHQLSEVGQKSAGVAILLTENLHHISVHLQKAGIDTGTSLSKSDDY